MQRVGAHVEEDAEEAGRRDVAQRRGDQDCQTDHEVDEERRDSLI